ncbi:MAG: efflux RND transporter permease subunit [Gammaproteobacteria bacterium]|nr:efflux RND transporter permease subunit [Rhodocyclaceae bacterium]MBU3908139.1 efflux RND transporter permease subunit [Gammaproteobacteria bacterium]MBU3989734.1 efflux RND transporter permease subunit [Gammaproteobacteria bacterium]MBU4005780.1 efflux RND transporter permease subunit [Gammaproteobacteria bacterium]MBU4021472.1 efflux RND transporter permease subunit [Gammaproteobacteria bacterium]
MKNVNLSAWALEHPSMVLYLMIVLMVGGVLAFFQLGRAEDPDFTFKVMVVRTQWPGATAREVEAELTERIEKKLQETPYVDVIKSASRAGESLVFIQLKDYTPKPEVPESWRQVRKKLDDIRHQLPAGVQGPFPNDEFGDVYVNIYALIGDGYDQAELRRAAVRMARELRNLADVKKVDLLGVQDEKIYVEVAPTRLASLGLTPGQVAEALTKQNAVAPAGFIETDSDRVRLRVTGSFDTVEQIRATPLAVGGRQFRLGDIAEVQRGLADPPNPQMRVAGKDAIGIAVVMARGGNAIQLGANLRAEIERLSGELPLGMAVKTVADQPAVAQVALTLFMKTLAEAVAIVMAVSFLTLGFRTGMVVALSIPLVLAMTFLLMKVFGIDLHRISLGALIISLGLLVDDAIIAVEMMVVKIEQGWEKFRAATFAYTSTAFPMLTGTLITVAGFTPVGFAKSGAGEFAFAIFAVTTIALLTSWIVAVVFTPYLGYKLLDEKALRKFGQEHHGDPYETPFYQRFRALVTWCLRRRWTVIVLSVLAFVVGMVLFNTAVQKQFFPPSSRPELLVDLWLPQGAALKATDTEVRRVEALLAGDEKISHFSAYVGNGAPRFYLPLDQQLFSDNFGQLVIVTKGFDEREAVRNRLMTAFQASDGSWSHLRTRVQRLENGPPVGYPVVFRVVGENVETLRGIASEVATVMRSNPDIRDVHLDWNEKAKSIRVDIDQARARVLGVSSQDVAQALQAHQIGATLTQFREGDQLIDIVWRAGGPDRGSLDRLADLPVPLASGKWVPLAQVAKLTPVLEEGVIWRRDRLPAIQVRADLANSKVTGPTVSQRIDPQLAAIRAQLPPGYRVEVGGTIEESAKNEDALKAVVPLMFIAVVTLLMMQLQSIKRTVLALLTAPLGLIGVALALIAFDKPFGFVANLGIIALLGMILRNSVILLDQIDQDEKAGKSTWEAIIGSAVRRFRPIMLTAGTAVLAMIPLSRQIFWGPMAVAIMGGLIIATALTLLFLPALYAAWYRVNEPTP